MELKVWVEGIQRVVCGISEQTTVQEVVIALAQATGRTGRYTLVEKWRDNEKLLPPSEHPIKVLEKWGEYASDVQFLLKRTGASTTNSDAENAKGPERNVYRQSLPPLAKSREKAELLQGLKRKEPKRKSLTITGSRSSQHYEDDGKEKRSQNSNGNNNKVTDEVSARYDRSSSGSVPANVRKAAQRFSANLSHEDQLSKGSKSKDKSRYKQPKDEQKAKRTALIPPHMQRAGASSATQALFPAESKSAVVAKSPVKKNPDNQIKNVNVKSRKAALMPPANKVLRSRNSSSTSDQQIQSLPNSADSGNDTNLNSASPEPAPLSLPNENKSLNYAHRYGNSLTRSKKKTLLESSNNSASMEEKRQSRDLARKTALMPPTHRQRAMTPNPVLHREAFRTLSTTDGHSPMSPIPVSSTSSEQAKAMEDFAKLVREQQRHIEEQRDTISALDTNIKSILGTMQQHDQDLDAQIAKLEDDNRALEMQYEREYGIVDELSAEESKVTTTQLEMDRLQGDIDQSAADIIAHERKTDVLSKAVSEEAQLQRAKQQRIVESNRNATVRNRKDIEHVNWNLSSMEEEINRIEKEISKRDEDINEKYSSLDTLNRELRQVNLQQFIRKTGSKVTVLPPETANSNSPGPSSPQNIYEFNASLTTSGSRAPIPPSPTQGENSEGVWV